MPPADRPLDAVLELIRTEMHKRLREVIARYDREHAAPAASPEEDRDEQ